MEKLTSLAAVRAGDVEKIQKLESELGRAAAHRLSYEEKGKKFKTAVEEVCASWDSGHTRVSPGGRDHSADLPTKKISAEQILLLSSTIRGNPSFRGGRVEPQSLGKEEEAQALKETT